MPVVVPMAGHPGHKPAESGTTAESRGCPSSCRSLPPRPGFLPVGFGFHFRPSSGGVKLPSLGIVQQSTRASTSVASPQAMSFQSEPPATASSRSPGFLLFAEDEGAQCREMFRTTRFNLTWGKDDLVHGQQRDLQNSPWIHGEMLSSITKALQIGPWQLTNNLS